MNALRSSAVLVSALWCVLASGSQFQVISEETQTIGKFKHTITVVQNGTDPRNRFKMHRVRRKDVPNNKLKNPIILVPALGNNFSSYTVGLNADGSEFKTSLAATLAKKNIDVYGYSPRASLIAPGACGTTVDCSIASTWGIASYAEDIGYIRDQVEDLHGENPAVGGHSLGGIVGTALVNANPDDYSGLLLLDSTLVIADETLHTPYQQLCAGIQTAIGMGQTMDSTLNPLAQALLQLSVTDPSGITPFSPPFPAGTTNRQAYLGFLTAPSPGPAMALFPPGFVVAAGSVESNMFTYANEGILAAAIQRFDFYVPNAVIADIACSFGGDATFTDNLAGYDGAVLAIKAGAGFGDRVDAELSLLTGADQTIVEHAGFGHVDPIVSSNRKDLVDKHIRKWLKDDVFKK